MKLKRCPNLHYYDEDKYDQCPHCGAPAPAAAPKPVFEPVPDPVQENAPEAVAEPAPEPIAAEKPTVVPKPAPEPVLEAPVEVPEPPTKVPDTAPAADDSSWRCSCGAVNVGKFCAECGSKRPAPEPAPAPAPAPVPEPEPAPAAQPERSLTEEISKASFTGTIEDAKEKAADKREEGVTQIIFDELSDELILGWVVVVNGSSKGKVFSVVSTKNTIGRGDPEHIVDIDLHNDRSISRGAQATMIYDPLNKKFFLQSNEGKTFVYVNREIVLTYKELSPYDMIRVGETDLVFVPLCNDKFSW